jgi:uncharacterized membrane protein YbhN (UPF0104 family)
MIGLALAQSRMLSAGGLRVSTRAMTALTYMANASSATFPGGPAIATRYTLRRLTSWGATASAAGFSVLASGLLSGAAFGLLLVTTMLLAAGNLSSILIAAGPVVAAATFPLLLRRRRVMAAIDRVAELAVLGVSRIRRRSPDRALQRVRQMAADLRAIRPRPRDWAAGFAFAGLNLLADVACLAMSCHAVGGRAGITLTATAYVAGMSAAGFAFIPSGIGVTEGAMVLAFQHGHLGAAAAVPCVVCHRLISVALVVAVGWLLRAAGPTRKALVIARIRRARAASSVAGTSSPISS